MSSTLSHEIPLGHNDIHDGGVQRVVPDHPAHADYISITKRDNVEGTARAAVSTRAGAVLSANTLVVAGTALAHSLKGAKPLSIWAFGPALCALVLVGSSVVFATQALVMLSSSERRFSPPRTAASTLYSLSSISREWPTFEQFRATVVDQSPPSSSSAEPWTSSGATPTCTYFATGSSERPLGFCCWLSACSSPRSEPIPTNQTRLAEIRQHFKHAEHTSYKVMLEGPAEVAQAAQRLIDALATVINEVREYAQTSTGQTRSAAGAETAGWAYLDQQKEFLGTARAALDEIINLA
ncbi:hypothetical protein AB0L82_05760 [Nocardia sp. NPDC052001]|uniref:hypothetical protein n=1 Tax=Nocardia sp. NPDC052001 TaxID=3154853 RepID=UPI003437EE85